MPKIKQPGEGAPEQGPVTENHLTKKTVDIKQPARDISQQINHLIVDKNRQPPLEKLKILQDQIWTSILSSVEKETTPEVFQKMKQIYDALFSELNGKDSEYLEETRETKNIQGGGISIDQIEVEARRLLFPVIGNLELMAPFLIDKIDHIFFVYAAHPSALHCYYSPEEEKNVPEVYFAGLTTQEKQEDGEKIKRGLILATPYNMRDFMNKKSDAIFSVVDKIQEYINKIKTDLDKEVPVAGAGIFPGIMQRRFDGEKRNMPKNFVDGVNGTVYTVVESFETTKKYIGVDNPNVVVTGSAGRIGSEVLKYLKLKNINVHGFEAYEKQDSPKILDKADIIINLFRKGDDILSHVDNLTSLKAIVDDTYPAISRPVKDAQIYKAISSGVSYLPTLPGFEPKIDQAGEPKTLLAGCNVQGMVHGSYPQKISEQFNDFGVFSIAAKKLGIKSPLIPVKFLNQKK